jgi:hypothetical protein
MPWEQCGWMCKDGLGFLCGGTFGVGRAEFDFVFSLDPKIKTKKETSC